MSTGATLECHRPHIAKIAVVGSFSGTHIGGSLVRAGRAMMIDAITADVSQAYEGSRARRALMWRFADKRPINLKKFANEIVARCAVERPNVLISTGSASLTATTLEDVKKFGIICANYSTDDPWNPAHRAQWALLALPHYDVVFTPRRANIADFDGIGCRDVRYLPFGYDETLFGPTVIMGDAFEDRPDVLFVGGADHDRAAFVRDFQRTGPSITLVGSYWKRINRCWQAVGPKEPKELLRLTRAAKVNLCLVRRANRDGHVMRSFEIAACGGCMLVEDTAEHREIFGKEGECVAYFCTPAEAAARARSLIADDKERARLSAAVLARILGGKHTYSDRLQTILAATHPAAKP